MTIEAMDVEALSARAAVHAALADPHRLAVVEALRPGDATPGELAAALDLGSNLLAHHLGVLEEAGLVARTRSQGDGRRRYVTLVAEPEDLLAHPGGLRAEHVLFVCSRNAARSQLAAALWRARTGRPAASVGATPADAVDPGALAVAARHGLDLGEAVPRGWDHLPDRVDLAVSVCDVANEMGLPVAARRVHWSVPDPHDRGPAAYAAVHDDLARRVDRLARFAA